MILRAWTWLRFGALTEAESDLRAALGAAAVNSYGIADGMVVGSLAVCALELVGPRAAAARLAEFETVAVDVTRAPNQPLPLARARIALADHRYADALTELEGCREWERSWGYPTAVFSPWRITAAQAHLALDDRRTARSLAIEQHKFATAFGSDGAIGAALHCRGLVERDVRMLQEAVSTLERSPRRLLLAKALVDLGAILRCDRRLVEARGPLRAGLDIALACGATPLADRARDELRAAGGRPRRERSTGTEALTPTELRTVRMAADGLSNRQIAQTSFVSPRTVEMHLSNAYRKLSVHTRDQLRAVLATSIDGDHQPRQ
jgi:DNA-binding CsgD family transcriptional regulator